MAKGEGEGYPTPTLLEAAETLLQTVYWMSGSGDFSPKGRARKGWLKARPKVERAAAAIAAQRNGG